MPLIRESQSKVSTAFILHSFFSLFTVVLNLVPKPVDLGLQCLLRDWACLKVFVLFVLDDICSWLCVWSIIFFTWIFPKVFFIQLISYSLVQPFFHFALFAMSRDVKSELSQCMQVDKTSFIHYVEVSASLSLSKSPGCVKDVAFTLVILELWVTTIFTNSIMVIFFIYREYEFKLLYEGFCLLPNIPQCI